MAGRLLIAYDRPGEKTLAVAATTDADLLEFVARRVLEREEARATVLSKEDAGAGALQGLEVDRLRRALGFVVPGFAAPSLRSLM